MKIFSSRKKTIIVLSGIALGLVAGFAYWRFVGCQSGTCGITANWHTSTLFGGVFGYLFADSVKVKDKSDEGTGEEN